MNATVLLSVYCVAILVASMAGGWLPLVLRPTHIRLQTYLSFASGAMLGAALCHMLPEATRKASGSWSYWTLFGLLVIFLLQRFLAFHHHEIPGESGGLHHPVDQSPQSTHQHDREPARAHGHEHSHGHEHFQSPLSWGTTLLGMSIHTLTGGFALASAVAADEEKTGWVGLSVFLATILHKPADSLTIASLMVSEGAQRRSAHVANLIFALMIPGGVALYFLASGWSAQSSDAFTGGALAFSAGTFLSIALSDLMPELQFHRHDRIKLSAALLAGVAIMFLTALFE